jgi:hypothetical protein
MQRRTSPLISTVHINDRMVARLYGKQFIGKIG